MSEFFAMGGYGFFVWTSYAVVLGGLCAFVLFTKHTQKSLIKKLKRKHEAKN